MAIANLAMATGNIGREGVGVNPLRGQNNVQGSCDMGSFPHEFSGYRHVSDDATREVFERLWGVHAQRRAGPAHPQHDRRGDRRRVQGSLPAGRGHRPVGSRHEAHHRGPAGDGMRRSSRTSSSTRRRATPMSSCRARRSSRRTAPSPTPSGASAGCARRSSRSPARRTGRRRSRSPRRWASPMTYAHPSEIMDEIAATTPTFRGVSYARLDELGSIQWPCNDQAPDGHADHACRPLRARQGPVHADRICRDRGARRAALPAPADHGAHPLAIQRRRADPAHRQRRLARGGRARDPSLRRREPRRSSTATSSRCTAGRARSRFRARVSERMQPGVVYTTFHHPDDRRERGDDRQFRLGDQLPGIQGHGGAGPAHQPSFGLADPRPRGGDVACAASSEARADAAE